MTFETPVHSFVVSSKVTFVAVAAVLGLALFVTVFLVFGQQMFMAQRLRRMRRRDDDSAYTKDMDSAQSTKTGFTDYDTTNDDGTEDNTYDGTHDNTYAGTYDGTYDDTITYNMSSSVWTGTTVHSTVQATANQTWSKVWRLGSLLVDRVVNGKPLRTPPAQHQQSSHAGVEDTSTTSESTTTTYNQMKDTETGTSNQSSNITNMVDDEYRQMEEDSIGVSASDSMDSMDVQASDRKTMSRYACGANDAAENAPTVSGIRTAAEKVQELGKGFVDKAVAEANWLLDADSEIPKERAPPPQRSNLEAGEQVEYHNMNVYTVGLGDMGNYSGSILGTSRSSDDDSSRDDVGPDTSSITPAAPRRQAVGFNFSTSTRPRPEQDKRRMIPKTSPRKGFPTPDVSSVSKVVHGTLIHGNRNAAAKQGRGKCFNKGSMVRWNEHARRQDKWTAASLNHYAEL